MGRDAPSNIPSPEKVVRLQIDRATDREKHIGKIAGGGLRT